MSFLKKYTNLTAYNADLNKDFPNVSYLVDEDEMKWNKYDPDHIVAKYDVTSTSEATKLLNSNSGITYQIIDGVQQQSIQMNYTFDTLGEHIVKYKLNGTSIGYTQFSQCQNLVSVTIPNSVTIIGSDAFYQCTGLTNVTIPNSVTSIGLEVFQYCSGLASVTIPNSVTSIGRQTFFQCTGLTSITVEATTPPTLGSNAFQSTNAKLVIYVPSESVDAYKAASGWSTYASRIHAIPE